MDILTDEMIKANKEEFIKILKAALEKREGADVEGLLNKLESSDFYIAPASTKYHAAYKGGLVDHSLNVYYNMMSLAKNKHLLAIHEKAIILDENGNPTEDYEDKIVEGEIEADSIAIVALLHDFIKMNYYKIDYRNKKVYCESGSKHDDLLSLTQHELYVGTHGAEDFLHLVVLVLVHHDVGLGLGGLACHSHIGDDGQLGETGHVFVSLDLVSEELQEEQHESGKQEADNEDDGDDHRGLGSHAARGLGILHNLTLVGGRCQGDGVLLTFLEQHQVEARPHLLLATDLGQHTLLFGSGRNL